MKDNRLKENGENVSGQLAASVAVRMMEREQALRVAEQEFERLLTEAEALAGQLAEQLLAEKMN